MRKLVLTIALLAGSVTVSADADTKLDSARDWQVSSVGDQINSN